jgi:hypothetical protein
MRKPEPPEETYAVRESRPLYHMRNGSDRESNPRPQRWPALMLISNIDLTTLPLSQNLLVHNVPGANSGQCMQRTTSHVWKLAFADWHLTYAFENLSLYFVMVMAKHAVNGELSCDQRPGELSCDQRWAVMAVRRMSPQWRHIGTTSESGRGYVDEKNASKSIFLTIFKMLNVKKNLVQARSHGRDDYPSTIATALFQLCSGQCNVQHPMCENWRLQIDTWPMHLKMCPCALFMAMDGMTGRAQLRQRCQFYYWVNFILKFSLLECSLIPDTTAILGRTSLHTMFLVHLSGVKMHFLFQLWTVQPYIHVG